MQLLGAVYYSVLLLGAVIVPRARCTCKVKCEENVRANALSGREFASQLARAHSFVAARNANWQSSVEKFRWHSEVDIHVEMNAGKVCEIMH